MKRMKRMRRSLTAQFTVTFGVVIAVVVAGFVVITVTAESLRSSDHQRAGSTRALVTANQLEQAVLDLETGLRGYLLAGQPGFLQPYHGALQRFRSLAQSLEAATAGDPEAQRLSRSIVSGVGDYVSQWAAPLIHTAQHDLGAARRQEAGGAGKARVDALRAQFAALLGHETELHAGQVSRSHSLATLVLVLGVVATALFLGLIVITAVRTERGLVAPLRQLAAAVAAITAGDLSVRIPGRGAAEVGDVVAGFNRMADALTLQRESLDDHHGELEAQKAELEEALLTLEERNAHIELVRRLGDEMVAHGAAAETVAVAALRGMGDGADCEIGAVYLLDVDTQTFVPAATRGVLPSDLDPVVEPGRGLAGRALAEEREVSVSY
jgi:methyl-accepting chemotaxis protein